MYNIITFKALAFCIRQRLGLMKMLAPDLDMKKRGEKSNYVVNACLQKFIANCLISCGLAFGIM